jgi:myo-inositol catabolism protein IolC
MALGYDKPLYILAFDHRGSFQKKFFGVTGEPNEEETARISDAKRVIYEGARRALDEGVEAEAAGVLVDEQFGADIARDARAEGFRLAMPVEKSGQEEFDFQYDDDFGTHIEAFDPNFSKVLVRYNTEGDRAMNERQAGRLKRLGDWLHEHGRSFLFELLVPSTPEQIATAGGDEQRWDSQERPKLMKAASSPTSGRSRASIDGRTAS